MCQQTNDGVMDLEYVQSEGNEKVSHTFEQRFILSTPYAM